MNRYEEKRKHERYDAHVPLHFNKLSPNQNSEGTGSVTRNLGRGGICFRASEFIPLAQRLILALSVPQIKDSIKVISKVAWIKKVEPGDEYEVGIQFLEMKKKDKESITDFLKSRG